MIAVRWTFTCKPGTTTQQQLINLLQEGRAALPNVTVRIYESHILSTPSWTVILEEEFESLAAAEQALQQYWAQPENAERMYKTLPFFQSSDCSIWVLH